MAGCFCGGLLSCLETSLFLRCLKTSLFQRNFLVPFFLRRSLRKEIINREKYEYLLEHLMISKQPPEVFYNKGVLKNLIKFTRKHLCQSLFFNKVEGISLHFLKMRLCHRCFPVNFADFLRTPLLQNTSW